MTNAFHRSVILFLLLVEVRWKELPEKVNMADGTNVFCNQDTVFKNAHFTCSQCGRENKTLEAVKAYGHLAPVSAYTLQCHCPECEAEGYIYGGRYFQGLSHSDTKRINKAEREWWARCNDDLVPYS